MLKESQKRALSCHDLDYCCSDAIRLTITIIGSLVGGICLLVMLYMRRSSRRRGMPPEFTIPADRMGSRASDAPRGVSYGNSMFDGIEDEGGAPMTSSNGRLIEGF